MKGIELPISTLIIIAVALLVLLGIVALWMGGWSGGSTAISVESAKASGCSIVMHHSEGCQSALTDNIIYDGGAGANHLFIFDADGNGTPGEAADTLLALCNRYYSAATETACRKICGCSG